MEVNQLPQKHQKSHDAERTKTDQQLRLLTGKERIWFELGKSQVYQLRPRLLYPKHEKWTSYSKCAEFNSQIRFFQRKWIQDPPGLKQTKIKHLDPKWSSKHASPFSPNPIPEAEQARYSVPHLHSFWKPSIAHARVEEEHIPLLQENQQPKPGVPQRSKSDRVAEKEDPRSHENSSDQGIVPKTNVFQEAEAGKSPVSKTNIFAVEFDKLGCLVIQIAKLVHRPTKYYKRAVRKTRSGI